MADFKSIKKYLNPQQEQDVASYVEKDNMDHTKLDDRILQEAMAGAMNIGGIQKVTYNPALRAIAEKYAKSVGMKLEPTSVELNKDLSKQIAQQYEAMQHSPNNPEVKAAYEALKKETLDQYKMLKEAGYKFEEIPKGTKNPYPSSKEMQQDVARNKHLYYYPTEQGFGSQTKILDNPLLEKTGEKIADKELVANDIFRIVHDMMGHAKEGKTFNALGEENAYANHMKMYSPEAQKALTTETRGQNSWVNFGPKGEYNKLNPANTIYADQKVGLLPQSAMQQNNTISNNGINIDELMKLNALKKLLGQD